MNAIEVVNLKKTFGFVKAVNNVSLSINKGEIFGYLGPNGAGKSTTIGCMIDFIRPDEGIILVNGQDVRTNITQLKENIGYLSPDVHLYSNLTGEEHIKLYTSVFKKSPLLDSLKRDFDFDLKKKTQHLSTGTKQKLAIILALMHKPEILILDEPTRGLDPILQNIFYKYLLELKAEGSTIFMSSHILAEVEKLCDRVGIIKAGKLISIETVASLKAKNVLNVSTSLYEEKECILLSKEPSVKISMQNKFELKFKYSGQPNDLLKLLGKYKLRDFEVHHADLEEIFLEYYK